MDDTQKVVAALRETAKKHARPAELGRLEISITPPGYDVPDKATHRRLRGGRRRSADPEASAPEMDAAALERFAAETGRAPRPSGRVRLRMKIARVEALHCDGGWRPWTFVRIETD